MGTPCWSLCLWLWLMYAGVDGLPNVRLRSRQEPEVQEAPSITILYLIDHTVKGTEKEVKTFISYVNLQAQQHLQSFFHIQTTLNNRTKYLKDDPNLQKLLEGNYRTPYVYLEGTIFNLTSYFEKKTHPDIICLVTGNDLYDGNGVRKGYGYSEQTTLCESVVTMLLAYSPYRHTDISRMLAELIRSSVNPKEVPGVHHERSNLAQQMKEYLRYVHKAVFTLYLIK
ncbi:uncharacterized protein LOC115328663 [Ixodes scapularis]|uniref:uncharacterized protein LOC115328663 n=1 Tax=Ixodes scapularis TaxID=6945 RepID=UPI001A9D0727|nr:uncharacterized protein LOC115328663 [Ixodes scapularis]